MLQYSERPLLRSGGVESSVLIDLNFPGVSPSYWGGLVDSEKENSENTSARGTYLFSETRKAGPNIYFFLLARFVRAALGWDVPCPHCHHHHTATGTPSRFCGSDAACACSRRPESPQKAQNLKFGKPVLEPYLDNQSVFFGGILLWLASPALALIPCQPGMVRSIADRSDGGF